MSKYTAIFVPRPLSLCTPGELKVLDEVGGGWFGWQCGV